MEEFPPAYPAMCTDNLTKAVATKAVAGGFQVKGL